MARPVDLMPGFAHLNSGVRRRQRRLATTDLNRCHDEFHIGSVPLKMDRMNTKRLEPAMNEIFNRKTVIYHILRKNVPSDPLTLDSGRTDKPAAAIIAILSRQILQCSRFIAIKCI